MTRALLAIEADSLSKEYGSTVAVKGVSLRVEKGEIFGFLGPNGAGKTTTIGMLTTLISPSAGNASVLGLDIRRQGRELRTKIGVVLQGESYEYSRTVEDALDIYGLLWDVPRRERRERIDELLETFQLAEHRTKYVQHLSAGLRRRLQVAREFLHQTDLLFLDEPTVGLDPIARQGTVKMIRESVSKGLTVFLTTQMLDEAESLCDRIAIISDGKIVSEDTPQGLKDRYGGVKLVEVSVSSGDAGSLVSRLSEVEGVTGASSEGDGRVRVWTTDPSESFNAIIRAGDELGLVLGSVTLREPTLEQAFINLVEKEGPGR